MSTIEQRKVARDLAEFEAEVSTFKELWDSQHYNQLDWDETDKVEIKAFVETVFGRLL